MSVQSIREWFVRQDAIEAASRRSTLRVVPATSSLPRPEVASTVDVSDPQRARTLSRLGVYSPSALKAAIKREAKKPYLVEGLFRTGSLNVLIGDSGLGKTPLAIQIGICIAAGVSLFGKSVQQGTVLYCDAESSPSDFSEKLETLSTFLGLSEPPAQFHVWSPHWDGGRSESRRFENVGTTLIERVNTVEPTFVVVDALRTFWPLAESKNPEAADTFNSLRKLRHVTWLILHHRRKTNQQVAAADLRQNPHAWFQEAAGAHALINHSDTRCGVVPHPDRADLLMGGFVRGSGPVTPLDLARAVDDEGEPIGYTLLTGAEHLNPADRSLFDALPSRFRFRDASRSMGGTSDSNTTRFLKKCLSLQILRKEGTEYVKAAPPVERVERME